VLSRASFRLIVDLRQLATEDRRWEPIVSRRTRRLASTKRLFDEPYYWAAFAYSGGG
jgi:CHAT domain-containing protein